MDKIDERNRKAEISKSVIKRYNIIYGVPQEITEHMKVQNPYPQDEKQEILARLSQEREDAEKKKIMDIERMVEEQEMKQVEVRRILNEKQTNLEHTMEEAAASRS